MTVVTVGGRTCVATVARGTGDPLGAAHLPSADPQQVSVNFAIYTTKSDVQLVVHFFPGASCLVVPLNDDLHTTGNVRHARVDVGLCEGGALWPDPEQEQLWLEYHYLVDGVHVLDPYAKLLTGFGSWGTPRTPADFRGLLQIPCAPEFDWGTEPRPHLASDQLVIYEMHVRGFTAHHTSGVRHPGLFLGVVERAQHLQRMGVTAIELLPVHAFNEMEWASRRNPITGEALKQYWGYSTVNFFAPMPCYATMPLRAAHEFKTMVKALHSMGMEVILDVVYNHTAEMDAGGPVVSYRALADEEYYMHDARGHYLNFSGCGNSLDPNSTVVQDLVVSSLRYWVTEMHVDGFRFDLASVLTRGPDGAALSHPPLVDRITRDPVLSGVRLIAEAWDAAGLYQVGRFPGRGRWAEWNGPYRDDIRRFVRGDHGTAGAFATRISGSQDLYNRLSPAHSINFVTAHDGFSLADLVSYSEKHNVANGEGNRDGEAHNNSWNCGAEGATADPKILRRRATHMRTLLCVLLLSQGTPMLSMGDEAALTRGGNNNGWCQDAEMNYINWRDARADVLGLVRLITKLIRIRSLHRCVRRTEFLTPRTVHWHGAQPFTPDWSTHARLVAFALINRQGAEPLESPASSRSPAGAVESKDADSPSSQGAGIPTVAAAAVVYGSAGASAGELGATALRAAAATAVAAVAGTAAVNAALLPTPLRRHASDPELPAAAMNTYIAPAIAAAVDAAASAAADSVAGASKQATLAPALDADALDTFAADAIPRIFVPPTHGALRRTKSLVTAAGDWVPDARPELSAVEWFFGERTRALSKDEQELLALQGGVDFDVAESARPSPVGAAAESAASFVFNVASGLQLYVAFNTSDREVRLRLPSPGAALEEAEALPAEQLAGADEQFVWVRLIDTSLADVTDGLADRALRSRRTAEGDVIVSYSLGAHGCLVCTLVHRHNCWVETTP